MRKQYEIGMRPCDLKLYRDWNHDAPRRRDREIRDRNSSRERRLEILNYRLRSRRLDNLPLTMQELDQLAWQLANGEI